MFKRIIVLALVVFFAAGSLAAIAGDGSSCKDKNALQCMYDWFTGCDKPAEKTARHSCMACGKSCCSTCQTDCSCNCCAKCGKTKK